MLSVGSAILLPLFASAALASAPCRGSCQHTIEGTKDSIPGVLKIDGPQHMVSDLSENAGWEVLDCPSTWNRGFVNVRAVCTDADPEAACHHVHQEGAENTIVFLPKKCGTGPVARIVHWGVAEDQSLPQDSFAAYKLRARNLTPQVAAVRLDYNFGAIPVERGEVSFDLVAAHHDDIVRDADKHGHVAHSLRRATNHPDYVDPQHVAAHVTAAPSPAVTPAPGTPADILGISIPPISIPSVSIPGVPISIPPVTLPSVSIPIPTSIPLPHLPDLPDISGGFSKVDGIEVVNTNISHSLIDESLSCSFGHIDFDQSAKLSVDAKLHVNAGYGFKLTGKLVPPSVSDFGVAGVLSGIIDSKFNIEMYLSADLYFPPLKIFSVGVPGLDVPGIMQIGPELAIDVQFNLVLDVSLAAAIPLKYQFNRLDFSFPDTLVKNGADAQASHRTSSIEINATPGDQSGSFGIHLVPKLQFGASILGDLASAELYVGVDMDATINTNGTINTDWSFDGCQDLSIGAVAKAGVSAGFQFLHTGDYIPLWQGRKTLWSHCSNPADGPATAIYKDDDGSYSNAAGDAVNENGQLVDADGNVIPDDEAEDADPAPIKGSDGNPIPEEDLVFDNGDGSYEDAQGNPTNDQGQRLSPNGTVMGCELDTSQPLLDADGNTIPPDQAIYEVGDGVYSDSQCNLVNEDGQLINADGTVIDFDTFKDDNGTAIPPKDVVIDNEDGTYMDAFGNPTDQWGGAVDFDDNGDVIPVDLTPATEEDDTQVDGDTTDDTDSDFTILTPDQLKEIAQQLLDGTAPELPTHDPSTAIAAPTLAPTATDTPPSTNSPTDTGSAPADPTLNPNPVPAPNPACKPPSKKRHFAKRSLRSTPPRPEPTQISANLRRKRAILGKRSGFGCSMPTIGGLPMTPALGLSDLGRMY